MMNIAVGSGLTVLPHSQNNINMPSILFVHFDLNFTTNELNIDSNNSGLKIRFGIEKYGFYMKITTIASSSGFNNKIVIGNADSAYFTHCIGCCVLKVIRSQ